LLFAQLAPGTVLARVDGGADATATNRVSITTEGGFRIIRANGIPDHVPGRFPNRGNPHRIAAQDHVFRVPLAPQTAAAPTPTGPAFFGVALNGVPFEAGTAEFWNRDRRSGWNYEAKSGFIDLGLDAHNAHVQPTGTYHYHALPTGLLQTLGDDGRRMVLVGWAADGFPIYSAHGHRDPEDAQSPVRKLRSSYRLKQGERPGGPGGRYDGKFTEDYEFVKGHGDLDECNGRFGVTPEFPQGTYHYHLTEEFPHVARLWRGQPDASFMKHGPGPGRFGPPPGGPPPRGARPGFRGDASPELPPPAAAFVDEAPVRHRGADDASQLSHEDLVMLAHFLGLRPPPPPWPPPPWARRPPPRSW
jgi:hypothetical protein